MNKCSMLKKMESIQPVNEWGTDPYTNALDDELDEIISASQSKKSVDDIVDAQSTAAKDLGAATNIKWVNANGTYSRWGAILKYLQENEAATLYDIAKAVGLTRNRLHPAAMDLIGAKYIVVSGAKGNAYIYDITPEGEEVVLPNADAPKGRSGDKNKGKYELTNDSIDFRGKILYRIKALRNFADVKVGDLGGYVESLSNLSHDGDCWVYDSAKVYGDASVYGSAMVFDGAKVYFHAKVYGNAIVFDDAEVAGNAKVYGYAKVFDNAKVYGDSKVYGDADVCGNAKVYGDATVYGTDEVDGNAEIAGNNKVPTDATTPETPKTTEPKPVEPSNKKNISAFIAHYDFPGTGWNKFLKAQDAFRDYMGRKPTPEENRFLMYKIDGDLRWLDHKSLG